MKTPVYNEEGKIVEEIELPDSIFNIRWNPDLVHQAYRVILSRMRKPIAHTKGRGEVRGGGKKPWRQKGTGRARHGSIRSPLWRGGGVTHGPTKERKFALKIPEKMRKKAIATLLSKKLKDGNLIVMEKISIPEGKTKNAISLLSRFPKIVSSKNSALVLLEEKDLKTERSFRNIPKAKAILAKNLNVYDMLQHKNILIPKGAINTLEKILTKA
jgi:large subunit ribosomal protein L4